ncbi:winged helix-turn-helix domain-containing protein [Croceibacterium sp. TMG7-5b_MA50]|uniref:winged helix-turn-helix domain-containing protein n=1 Tax=Croceibacterium sp. TMG7-5b_MA50 TaxID=3121290 RepID=UPI003221A626
MTESGGLPPDWDLRRCGWELCTHEGGIDRPCAHPLLLDARGLTDSLLSQLPGPFCGTRLVVLGITCSTSRAKLLARGCAEVLGSTIGLAELATRVRRVQAARTTLPRARHVGPLLLDLLHRDARRGSTWLGLHPREFGVLWRLADEPGKAVTRRTLLQDVWRIHHEPETNSVEVHVSRLRGKLALAGCGDLVRTATSGGYRLDAHIVPVLTPAAHGPETPERLVAI